MKITERMCVICGESYIPYNNGRQKTCSLKCGKALKKQYANRYQKEHRISSLKYSEMHSNRICKLCGKRIEPVRLEGMRIPSNHMHEECVISDCVKTLESGERLSGAQYQRAYSRGYSLDELKELAVAKC